MFIDFLSNKLLLSFIIVSSLFSAKFLIVKWLTHRATKKNQDKRLVANLLNNAFGVFVIIALFYLWADEIQRFAFSITAFVVAIVLATREFIQCLIGFIYLIINNPFRIGDWIQIGNNYGEVHSSDWAKITLLEVNIDDYQYTGKTLYLPNSQLITSAIKNLNFLKRYANHSFTITRDGNVNPYDFLDVLYEKANEYCADFKDVAIRYNQLIENRLGISIAGPDASISITTSDLGRTRVHFTVFCPTERTSEIQEKLTRDFMLLWFIEKKKSNLTLSKEKED